MTYLDRRAFLAGAIGSMCNASAPSKAPNILLFIADDMSWHDIGCYGNSDVRTPNIDRLAGQGMRFTRAFTGTAMCAPMRQQMYTGLFPVRNGAYPNHSKTKPGTRSLPHYLKPLGYRVGLTGKWHIGPDENFPFERLGDEDPMNFKAIRDFVNRDAAQPYCLVVCSHEPHGPWNKGDASRYPAAKLSLPPYFVDTPETRKALAAYYAEVEYADGQAGECMRIVEQGPRPGNSMFVFCSEQGSGVPHAKWTCYDAGLREGFLVRWPDRVRAGSQSGAMIQGVDFVPTVLEAAGGRPEEAGFDGRSYLAVLEGRRQTHHDAVFGVHTTRGIIEGSPCYPVRSIRTESHKLILNLNHPEPFRNVVTARGEFWASWLEKAGRDAAARKLVEGYQRRPEVEFYDVAADPYELDNLAGDPRQASAIAGLRRRLESWMAAQGDQGVETEMQAPARAGGSESKKAKKTGKKKR